MANRNVKKPVNPKTSGSHSTNPNAPKGSGAHNTGTNTAAHTFPDLNAPNSKTQTYVAPAEPAYDFSADYSTRGGDTNVKVPAKNVLDLSDVDLSPETTTDLLFQEIGGVELSNLLTFGSVKGINQKFKVISNIEELRLGYDPTRLLAEQAPGLGGIKDFSIDINSRIPNQEVFVNGVLTEIRPFITIERDTEFNVFMNLVIELENIEGDEEVEIQIITSGNIIEIS